MSRSTVALLIVTDAWSPQTNGVVTTLESVIRHLPEAGIETTVVHPGLFATWPLPSYPEIRVARNTKLLRRIIETASPDAIHIATEGPLGLSARRYCRRHGLAFTTSLHTKFPEYAMMRFGIPLSIGYRFLRWFHQPSHATLVTTQSHQQELEQWGLDKTRVWGRGVDTQRFRPVAERRRRVRPRLLYVGRVAVEKNIEAFLSLDLPADKVIVGDGPARQRLESSYPEAHWLGFRHGEELVAEYAAADVMVFPSLTDTFGLVMLEAMACGTPVAAFPVTGPKDVISNGLNGWLHDDLQVAIERALLIPRGSCRQFACDNDWRVIAERFAASLVDHRGTRLPDMNAFCRVRSCVI